MILDNPPHPGEFINEVYLQPYKLSCRYLAEQLGVAPSTLSGLLKGQSSITPEMALRLSKALGRTPESWLKLQDNYSLWQAKQTLNKDKSTAPSAHDVGRGERELDALVCLNTVF